MISKEDILTLCIYKRKLSQTGGYIQTSCICLPVASVPCARVLCLQATATDLPNTIRGMWRRKSWILTSLCIYFTNIASLVTPSPIPGYVLVLGAILGYLFNWPLVL